MIKYYLLLLFITYIPPISDHWKSENLMANTRLVKPYHNNYYWQLNWSHCFYALKYNYGLKYTRNIWDLGLSMRHIFFMARRNGAYTYSGTLIFILLMIYRILCATEGRRDTRGAPFI